MKGIVVIPACKEFETLGGLISKIPSSLDVLVIDDSGKKIFRSRRAQVIQNSRNLGKGASLRKGFSYAIEKGYPFVIMMDADGEHPPGMIRNFVSKIENYDIVFGQRSQSRSLSRKLLNRFSSFWFKMMGIYLNDVSCGFIAIKVPLLRKLNLSAEGYDIDLQIILESFRNYAKHTTQSIRIDRYSSSGLGVASYLMINNRFDRWVLSNLDFLWKRIGFLKTIIIESFALLGLIIGWIPSIFLKKKG
jgi:hypothetical protein